MIEIKKTIEVYDKVARQYCDYLDERLPQFNLTKFISFVLKNRMDELYEEIKTRETKGKKGRPGKPKKEKLTILDAGCGSARDVEYLTDEGFEVTGIDVSEKIIKEAKKRVKGAKLKVMDLRELSFKKKFDGIWCFGAMGHVPKKDLEKTLKGFHDTLKDNGILFISTLEGEGEEMVERKELMKQKVFYSFYGLTELELKLEEAGFEIISSVVEEPDEKFVTLFARKKD